MIRNLFVAAFAFVMTAGAFGGTTAVLDAQVTAPVAQVA
jgi:hypothetical protein